MSASIPQLSAPPGAFRILVVDDSPSIRSAVVDTLERAGFQVTAAADGEEALRLTLEQLFDLVVSDVEMGAITGVQLCRVLRSDPGTAELPIILLTAATEAVHRFWGRHAGADAYLAKKDMKDVLVPTVNKLLEGKKPTRGSLHPQYKGSPLERLSNALDRHLFNAVVVSETRKLMDHVHDRAEFATEVMNLAADVIGCPYLVLELLGPTGPTHTVHVRGPWLSDSKKALKALGVPCDREANVEMILDDAQPQEGELQRGKTMNYSIAVRGETLAVLQLHTGATNLVPADLKTAQLLCESLGPATKSLFLMEEARVLALTDGLTGLYNRRHITQRLEEEIARSKRVGSGLCVALCDIDHFKAINDEYGHNAGDQVLRELAKNLTDGVRSNDVVGRWGGEEFLVIFSEIKLSAARIVAERLRSRLENAPPVQGGPNKVTASIGLAMLDANDTAESLLENADQALYRAKARGRNRVELASEMSGMREAVSEE